MTQELYKRYRPKDLSGVLGQDEAVRTLEGKLKAGKMPHSLMLSGPSGTGKTTLARILRKRLGCSKSDYNEVNCAVVDGAIETVRNVKQRMGSAPIDGKCRIWFWEEIQSLSRAGFAQQAMLGILEDTPSHVYFILATTDPTKVIKAIHTRCLHLKLSLLKPETLKELVADILLKEKAELPTDLIDLLVESADGSARQALVTLDKVLSLEDASKRREAIVNSDSRKQAHFIAKLLLEPRTKWGEVAKVLKEIEDEPETVRRQILGYARAVLLNGGPMAGRAYELIVSFEGHFYDSGAAGLVRACYEVNRQK